MKEKTEMLRYSAIIVDDEAIVREGLVKHFDWKKYSIEIKGCFADGTDAWEFLKNQEKWRIILDIFYNNFLDNRGEKMYNEFN